MGRLIEMSSDSQSVTLCVENDDWHAASHALLAQLAYPGPDEDAKRVRFIYAADCAYQRFLRAVSASGRREGQHATAPMPAQQSQNALRQGLRRVGHRIAAAYLFRTIMASTQPGLVRVRWDGSDVNTARVSRDGELPLSVLSALRDFAPGLRRLMSVGGLDLKALKNLQDRVMRPSYPVLHIANAVVTELSRASFCNHRLHWTENLLQRPQDWVAPVVRQAMSGRDAFWIGCRSANILFPYESMVSVELVETLIDAA